MNTAHLTNSNSNPYIFEGFIKDWPIKYELGEPLVRAILNQGITPMLPHSGFNGTFNIILPFVFGKDLNEVSRENIKRAYGTRFPYQTVTFSVNINTFTNNCGMKSITGLYCNQLDRSFQKQMLEYLESFLLYKCNAGVVVASDYVEGPLLGRVANLLINAGNGYIKSKEYINPNYATSETHRILLMYKELDAKTLPNYWV